MDKLDKYIFKKSKCLTKEECDYIIKYFDSLKETFSYEKYSVKAENLSSNLFPFLTEKLLKHIHQYSDKHSFLKNICHNWGIDVDYNIQKYLPNQFYSGEHCEHGPLDVENRRILVWMIYLNDIKNGGGTYWTQQRFRTKPRTGDLYIWPAAWTHSHHGINAPKEIKYIVTGWCSMSKP